MLVQSKFSLEACFQVGYERNPVGCVVDQGNDVNRMFGPRLMSTRPARARMEQAGTKCVIQCEVRIESADTICVACDSKRASQFFREQLEIGDLVCLSFPTCV